MRLENCIDCGNKKIDARTCFFCPIYQAAGAEMLKEECGDKFKPFKDDGKIHCVGGNGEEVTPEEWLKLRNGDGE